MKLYKMLAKEFLAEYTDTLQELRNLTHEEMAERLRITSRAYGDLEREQYRFSAIARLFLLLMLNADELKAFLKGFRKRSPPKHPRYFRNFHTVIPTRSYGKLHWLLSHLLCSVSGDPAARPAALVAKWLYPEVAKHYATT